MKREYTDLLRRADVIFIKEHRGTADPATGKCGYDLTRQAFAVFLPVSSVRVMGDGRTYTVNRMGDPRDSVSAGRA